MSTETIVKKPALSISALEMMSKCGEQYRRRYIEREIIPPGVALIVGRGVDASVNKNLTRKIEKQSLLSSEEIADTARDAVVNEWTSGDVALSEDEVKNGIKKTRDGAIDKAVRLSVLHGNKAAPTLEPTAVQRKWRVELPGFPVDLTGVIDVEEGNVAVRDTKTSSKSPREDEAHLSDQLTLYALAKKVIDRAQDLRLILDYLVDTKDPKYVTRETKRTDDDFRVMLRRIEVASAAIEKGVFVPARQSDWFCSTRWCGFANTCPYYRKPVSVAIGQPSEE